jgi:hypothetical protein
VVFWKNIFPDFRDHVVSVDISKNANRPIIEFRVEIFITDQHDQFIICDVDRHNELAFLNFIQ